MDRHALTVLVALLWTLVLIAAAGALNQSERFDNWGRPITPSGRFLAFWTGVFVVLLLVAVGLTAWLAS